MRASGVGLRSIQERQSIGIRVCDAPDRHAICRVAIAQHELHCCIALVIECRRGADALMRAVSRDEVDDGDRVLDVLGEI